MIIFTDASYSNQTKVSGYGFVVLDKDFDYKAGNYSFEPKDNNVAEIGAISEALSFCQKHNIFNKTKDKNLTIITDSKVAVRKILMNLSGNSKFEEDKLENIRKILNSIKNKLKITIFQIKGHSKEKDYSKFGYYNEVCDAIAGDYRYIGEIEKEKNLKIIKNKKRGGR